ncbi:MAG: DUF3764 family protein [Prochlorococcus sp.]|jgi:hypothetical protein
MTTVHAAMPVNVIGFKSLWCLPVVAQSHRYRSTQGKFLLTTGGEHRRLAPCRVTLDTVRKTNSVNNPAVACYLMETTVCTFKLSVPFAQWVAIFDSEDVSNMHATAGVTPLYRGVSTDDPSKVVVIHQAATGVATKLMEDNKELIESSGHIWTSTELSTYTTE